MAVEEQIHRAICDICGKKEIVESSDPSALPPDWIHVVFPQGPFEEDIYGDVCHSCGYVWHLGTAFSKLREKFEQTKAARREAELAAEIEKED